MRSLRVVCLIVLLLGVILYLRRPLMASNSFRLFLPIVRRSAPHHLAFTGYTGQRGFGNQDIYLADIDGTHAQQLTSSEVNEEDPTWSPEGTRIAFSTWQQMPTGMYTVTLRLMNRDSTNIVTLTTEVASDRILGVSWSPDGTRLAFASCRDQNYEIYTVHIDGSHLIRLTNNLAFDGEPTWSPDSTQLAFISARNNATRELYTMRADGTNVQQLTTTSLSEEEPAWSPDGRQIAFSRSGLSINVYDLQDGTDTEIYHNPSSDSTLSGVAWSSDSQQLVFSEGGRFSSTFLIITSDGIRTTVFTNPLDVLFCND